MRIQLLQEQKPGDLIEIPYRLERFVRDFDNFEEAKYIYFDQIKTGEYKF